MINRVKKLEFIFKTSAAHTETINPLVSTNYTPTKKTKVKSQREAVSYSKTVTLVP